MNTRNISILIIALAVIGALIWYGFEKKESPVLSDKNNDGVIDERDEVDDTDKDDNTVNEPQVLGESVRLLTPRVGATVSSPLVIKGEARGWYFEGSFPVKIIGPDGKVLAQGPAQAQSDWMTSNWVPFEATLHFIANVSGEGKLVLSADNPSGLPQYDASVEIPIRFTKTETMEVKAFFNKEGTNFDVAYECSGVTPVLRVVTKTTASARASLLELLKGPTSVERKSGYSTSIPEGVVIQKLEIKNGIAYVDFNSALQTGVGGSCRVLAIRSQIENTLKQFATIKSVVISIDGRTEDILQP